jgi:hypothetical protein
MKKLLLLNIQMYEAKLPTDGTHELQDTYPEEAKALFRKTNNVRQFFGTEYEGDPLGGAVKITVRDTEVTVADYDIVTGTPITTGATIYMNVLVNKNKAINELIDDYEASAVPDNLRLQRLTSGVYTLQRTEELDAIAEIRDSLAANDSGNGWGQTLPANPSYESSATVLTNTTAYNAISVTIGTMLDNGVDPEDICVAISTATETLLLEDVKYTNTASEAGSAAAKSGIINMIRGAKVTRSSNLGVISAAGDNVAKNALVVEYIVFSPLWAKAGDKWKVEPQIVNIMNSTHIGASRLIGREVYFNALTDSKGAIVKGRTA